MASGYVGWSSSQLDTPLRANAGERAAEAGCYPGRRPSSLTVGVRLWRLGVNQAVIGVDRAEELKEGA